MPLEPLAVPRIVTYDFNPETVPTSSSVEGIYSPFLGTIIRKPIPEEVTAGQINLLKKQLHMPSNKANVLLSDTYERMLSHNESTNDTLPNQYPFSNFDDKIILETQLSTEKSDQELLMELETTSFEEQFIPTKSELPQLVKNNFKIPLPLVPVNLEPNKTTANKRPHRPRPSNVIPSENDPPRPLKSGQSFQTLPNLFKPLSSFPTLVFPTFNWPAFTEIFQGLFKAQGPEGIQNNETHVNVNHNLKFYGMDHDCEVKTHISNVKDVEDTLLCRSETRSSLSCSQFCVRNGFVEGECNDESFCVCQLIDGEKKIGEFFCIYYIRVCT